MNDALGMNEDIAVIKHLLLFFPLFLEGFWREGTFPCFCLAASMVGWCFFFLIWS